MNTTKFVIVCVVSFLLSCLFSSFTIKEKCNAEAKNAEYLKQIDTITEKYEVAQKEADYFSSLANGYRDSLEVMADKVVDAEAAKVASETEYEMLVNRIKELVDNEALEYENQGLLPSPNIETLRNILKD